MNIENKFSTEDIVKATSGILINGDMGITFRGISTDTRTIKPGYLFWALKGTNYDGHDFWKEAIDKGAKGLVISRFPSKFRIEELPKTISVVFVKDTLKALGDLAHFWRKKLNCSMVAITGSCGKTTTKELTYEILSKFWKCAKNEANYNNLIGVPLSILSIKEGTDIGILELGTNAPGEIERLSQIVSPQISVITCIYPSHLESLGTMEGVLEEKINLFKNTDPNGILIYNYDQDILREKIKNFPQKKISFGLNKGADLYAENFKIVENELKGEVVYCNKKFNLKIPYIGKHNLQNLLAALSVVVSLDLDLEKIISELGKSINLFQRTRFYKKGNFLIVDDTYNANPGSMKAAFEYLKDFSGKKRICILGDMKELGKEAEKYHREIGKLAGEIADLCYFVGDMAEVYGEAFSISSKPFKTFKNTEELLENLNIYEIKEFCPESGIIFVKGSRALKMERIVEKLFKELD
ncbi:UDP-N-acetylmuramoyl-tripeptide--D-alanyl-D-alanine ligase [Thermodesulfobacterium hydrogeniphilum]|uniref:UDP-N-acetylmuramoyl-tripeptide--D-alanyl-D- alanine ligase n=1 Tax=Thermodesulfobacterium hydrogeniphilum TaxID=161156 RepID=UPI0005715155|nr:UDP-N-acetylmuramoyl-tripeptide--D-alanyl-D-alanine ligase [Thermodesulfobacterium hydrogeniphilum]